MAFLFFGQNLQEEIFSFSLVDGETRKNNEKMFLLTGKYFVVLITWLSAHFHPQKL